MKLKEYVTKNNKKHLIFDFDETIMWAKIDWAGVQQGRYEYLKNLLPKLVKNDKGTSPARRVDEANARFGNEYQDEIFKNETRLELENVSGFEPNPEIIDFIIDQWEHYEMYVWSSNTKGLIEAGLKTAGIEHSFKQIIGKDDVLMLKPKAFGFFNIFNPEIHLLSDFLMVGNSVHSDGGAAEASGIDFYHVRYFDQ